MPLRLTLIICTYCRPEAVRRLLASLRQQTRSPDEVLVVDASADAATRDAVAGTAVSYHQVGTEHRGLTRQRNFGLQRATGEIVAFLDDDTVPAPTYFAELLACFERHPDAVGVGGYITNELLWERRPLPAASPGQSPAAAGHREYRWGAWVRRVDLRWRLRAALGLVGNLAPGWMPRCGHGRTTAFYPPDGRDYPVEFVIGASMTWRRSLFEHCQFSTYFTGYGLYEDMDFCIRAGHHGGLYLCTPAQLEHHHVPAGRPQAWRYGVMVARNGWFVWRRRWPAPGAPDTLRWWLISGLLTLVRLGNAVMGPARHQSLAEAGGRMWGLLTLLWNTPREHGAQASAPRQEQCHPQHPAS